MTHKVMIIDDEPWIVKDIIALLDWNGMGYQIAAVSSDVWEAELLISKHAPDLILCDIRMPGMSGLELMEKVKRKHPGICFLFMSAYSEFTYAVRAVQLGAFDYLIKPVGADMLESSLQRIKLALAQQHQERSKKEMMRNTLLMMELLDGGFPHRIAIGRLAKEGMFRTSGGSYSFVVAQTTELEASERVQELLREELESCLANTPSLSAMLGQGGAGKWFVLVHLPASSSIPMLRIWRGLRKQALRNGISFGISSPFAGLDRIRQHYRDAERMARMRWMTGQAGVYVSRLNRSGKHPLLDGVEQIRMTTHYSELGAVLASIAARCCKQSADPDTIALLYNEAIRQTARLDGWLKEQDVEESSVEELLSLYASPAQLFEELIDSIRNLHGQDGEKDSRVVNDVLQEIESHYNDRLSLASIASKHFINANYLSQLFKQKTGRSFKQHLVETRLAKAAELLREGRLTLQEISSQVGYDDYFHFSKLFKKYRGVSPADLRKSR